MLNDFEPATVAAALLVRPPYFRRSDDRLYSTHAPIVGRADNSGDLLADSNFETVRDHLFGFAHENDCGACLRGEDDCPRGRDVLDSEDVEDLIDAGISHFAAGPCSELFVRVHEVDGSFTPIFIEACRVLEQLAEYPIFDEDDYSTRCLEAFDSSLTDAIKDASYEIGAEDSAEDTAEITAAVYASDRDSGALYDTMRDESDVDYEAVAELYAAARDAVYEARAAVALADRHALLFDPMPGQLALI